MQEKYLAEVKIDKMILMSDFLKKRNLEADFDGKDRVLIINLNDKNKAVFKKEEDENVINASILAYKFAEFSSLAYTPIVIQRKINGKN